MHIQDHFSISVNLDVGHGQVCVPLGHSSLYFCMWAAPFWAIKCYDQVSPDKSLCNLCKTSSESAERNFLSTITVFHRLGAANVTDLCRNSLAEQN